MSQKITTGAQNAMFAALKTALDGGKVYIFAGAVPADAGDALNMAATHTELAIITLNDTGTGLTFATPTTGVLSKTDAEVWLGLIDFDGFAAGAGTNTASFYRFCPAGDNGRGAAPSASRLQGTVGGPASSADMKLTTSAVLTANGSNKTGAEIFVVRLN